MGGWSEPGLLAAALTSSPLATVVLDPDGRLQVVNPAAERLLGRGARELLGAPAGELFPDDDGARSLALLEAAARGETGHIEMRWRTGDGGTVEVGVSWAPVHADGEVVGVVGVGRDIRRRKALERDLRTLADSFRALAEGVDQLAIYRFRFDPALAVEDVSPHFETLFGVTRDELRTDPAPLWRRLDPHARHELDRSRRGEDVGWPIEAAWEHPEGHTLHFLIHEVPLRREDGRLTGVLGVARDVTQLRRERQRLASALDEERSAAEELREVDQLRQVFLQAVSHELRTPLTSVLGFAATLRDRGEELHGDQVREVAARLAGQAARMQALLDDLLDVDRLSRGVLGAERAPTDIAALVRRICADHGADLHLEVASCVAEVDRSKIERIVDNLVRNARRHAGPAARVRVRLTAGEPVRLEVDDDGPGVPVELRATVFEPFAQGRTATGDPSPGTGIGLTLVRAFAELHDGRVEVGDSDLGGARFVVELPACDLGTGASTSS